MDDNCVLVITEVINMIATFGAAIIGGLITGVFILAAAIIAYKGGLQTYFKRREHEQIIKRYLDEGIDRVLAGVNQAERVFVDNHITADIILGRVQESREVDIPVRFQRFDRHILELTPYHKVTYLVGDKVFQSVIEMFLGFVDGQYDFLSTTFKQTISKFKNKSMRKMISAETTLEKIKQRLDEYYERYEKYFPLTQELQHIASLLEKQTSLSWANLEKFKEQPEIKDSVKKMKQIYAELEKS